MKRLPSSELAGTLSVLAPLVVYAATVAPDLGSIDSGELASVCAGLGIAHPTGYPLYTLLGRLSVLFVPAATPIARVNLLSAILTAASCLFVFLLLRGIASRVRPEAPAPARDLLALGGTWLWSVHTTLWDQATSNEVHALQALLISALLWMASSETPRRSFGGRILSFYLLGLAFTNHLTVLYLVPGLIAGFFLEPHGRAVLRRPRELAVSVAAALVPLTLYVFLPIRAGRGPLQDWGNPTSWARIVRHVGAAQYRVWMFASGKAFETHLAAFLAGLVRPSGILVLLAAAAGAIALARRDRPGFARLTLGFVVGTLWASNYDIHDLDPYFLGPRLCLAGLAGAGAALLLPSARSPRWRTGIVVLPLAAAVALAGARWREMSKRGDHFVRLYAESLLDRLPQNAILLSRHWDIVVSPLVYLQQVEHRRPDVTVVDTELLRRSWYFLDLERADPSLLAPIRDRVKRFLEDLDLFESGQPYDGARIEEHYRAVIAGIFESHRAARPVFYTPDVEPTFFQGWFAIPEALAIRIVPDSKAAPEARPLDPDAWAAQARYVNEPVRRDAWAFPIELGASRVRFLESQGRSDEADLWRQTLVRLKAIEIPRAP